MIDKHSCINRCITSLFYKVDVPNGTYGIFCIEYSRGHRFIMNTPDKVLRGGSGLQRYAIPLYFPCPCRSGNPKVAQLMRIHIVTPKAPVNISIDPKVSGKESTQCDERFIH